MESRVYNENHRKTDGSLRQNYHRSAQSNRRAKSQGGWKKYQNASASNNQYDLELQDRAPVSRMHHKEEEFAIGEPVMIVNQRQESV